MSKKSRRRNKKILGALGALIGAGCYGYGNKRKKLFLLKLLLAESADKGSWNDIEFKETLLLIHQVYTKTTIMNSMPARPKG